MNFNELYRKLMKSKDSGDVEKVLEEIGGTGTIVDLSKPMSSGYRWIPYGDDLANPGLIDLGSSPGNALAERTTNSFDAMIEAALIEQGVDPSQFSCPFEAAEALFGRDEGEEWVPAAPSVWIVLGPEETEKKRGRVDVLDVGTGVGVEEFSKTLVSLHGRNKGAKPWLVGTFGQGGSVSLSFSKYVLLVSKKIGDDRIAFTICRKAGVLNEKMPAYLYLVDENGNVPFVEAREVNFYPEYASVMTSTSIPDKIKNGTLCRHFGFSLAGIKSLFFTRDSLWDTMNVLLFDSILPIRCVDLRGDVVKKERVLGSRRRLEKLSRKSEEEDVQGRTSMRYRRAPFMIKPKGFDNAVKVELWVAYALKLNKKKGRLDRRNGSEVFLGTARANQPIIFTNNGQCHGSLGPELIAEAGLTMTRKHIVINIDCSGLNGHERGQLLTSDREKLKQGEVLDYIKDTIREDLQADETLAEIEVELEDEIFDGISESDEETRRELSKWAGDDEEIKKGLGEVFKGWSVRIVPPKPKRRTKKGKRSSRTHLPLATLPFPQVTACNIVAPVKDGYKHYIFKPSTIRVETNADEQFWSSDLVRIRSVPEGLVEVRATYPLSGGRMGWMLDLDENKAAEMVGQSFDVVVDILSPSGEVLISDTRKCVVAAVQETVTDKQQDLMIGVQLIGCDENEKTWEEMFEGRDPDSAGMEARLMNSDEDGKKTLVVFLNKSHERLKALTAKMREQKRENFIRKFKLFGGMMGVRAYLYRKNVSVDGDELANKKYHDFVSMEPLIEYVLRIIDAEEKAVVASK